MLLARPPSAIVTWDQPGKGYGSPSGCTRSTGANLHGQATVQSFTLGLSTSTYHPNINLSVLLTQCGTLCQAHISCLESCYQRGKTPRVYELATWHHFPAPCSGDNSLWDYGRRASPLQVSGSVGQWAVLVVLLGTKLRASDSAQSGIIGWRSGSALRVYCMSNKWAIS